MVYIYGHHALVEWATEAAQGTAPATGVFNGISHLRSLSFVVNENTEAITDIVSGHGRGITGSVKGMHTVTGSMEFWLADDFGDTVSDVWIVKLPLDKYNVTYGTAQYVIPQSTYSSDELLSFTLEVGHNTASNIRVHQIVGCMVDSFTFKVGKGEKCLFTYDFIGLSDSADNATFTNGSATRSSNAPLGWHNVKIFYDDAAAMGSNARNDFTMMTFTVSNNLDPNFDLTVNVPERAARNTILGQQLISGSFTVNKTTTANLAWYDWLLSDASAPYLPAESVTKKDIQIDILNSTAPTTQYLRYALYNCVVASIPMDIDPEKVQELTIPYTAEYIITTIKTTDATPPTNWNNQAA